jgi:hypothetical protein
MYEVECPYVILNAEIEFEFTGDQRPGISVSLPDGKWSPLKVDLTGNRAAASAKEWLSRKNACYGFKIRFESDKGDPAESIHKGAVTTTFQFAPRAVPQVAVGTNSFLIAIKNEASTSIELKGMSLEFEWEEILRERRP